MFLHCIAHTRTLPINPDVNTSIAYLILCDIFVKKATQFVREAATCLLNPGQIPLQKSGLTTITAVYNI